MRLAVLGAGGMLGHKMATRLAEVFSETWAVFRKSADVYEPYGIFDSRRTIGNVDALDFDALDPFLDRLGADVIINCIGLTTRKLSGRRESDVVLANSFLPHRLKEWCLRNDKRLIHFSTDCVFSGENGPYDESAVPDADDLYGRSKALGEVSGAGILTIRSSIIGLEIEGRTELLEWLRSQRGSRIRGYKNVMYSGVTTSTMADVVAALLRSGVAFDGVHQLASQAISKFDLLSLASEVLGLNVEVVPVEEPRSNKVLVSGRFFNDQGVKVPSWRDQLREVANDIPSYERWKPDVEKKSIAS